MYLHNTQPHNDQPSNPSSRPTGKRSRRTTTSADPHHNNNQQSTTHVPIRTPRTLTPQWAPTPHSSNTGTSSNLYYPLATPSYPAHTCQLRTHTMQREIHGVHVVPHSSATTTYTPQDYATPPIPTFAIDFAGTKTYHQHTLIYTTTSLASTEQTPTIIAPNATSRKRNRPSQATSQTIDRQLATQTHPPPLTSNVPHSNSSSRDTNAGADAYLKESIATTKHSTAPTPQTCNPVTSIDNGSMVQFPAPTTL